MFSNYISFTNHKELDSRTYLDVTVQSGLSDTQGQLFCAKMVQKKDLLLSLLFNNFSYSFYFQEMILIKWTNIKTILNTL